MENKNESCKTFKYWKYGLLNPRHLLLLLCTLAFHQLFSCFEFYQNIIKNIKTGKKGTEQ